MEQQNAVYNALSKVVNSKLNFVSMIDLQIKGESEPCFLCLGKHQFFLLTVEDFSEKDSVYYAHIDNVLLDKKRNVLVQITVTDDRNPETQKFTVFAEDRDKLVASLKSAWKTDHMFRCNKVGQFPESEGRVADVGPIVTKKKEIPPIVMAPQPHYARINQKDYSFFLPTSFRVDPSREGFYLQKAKGDVFEAELQFQILDSFQVEDSQVLKEKEDIKFFCRSYALNLVPSRERYWILLDQLYFKRMNLLGDKASWHGWETHIRTNSHDIIVIFLRRKYIPPLMDYATDLMLVSWGPQFTQATPSVDVENCGDALRRIVRDAADSIFIENSSNMIYKVIVQEKVNALLVDEETCAFYQHSLEINPKGFAFSCHFLLAILRVMQKAEGQWKKIHSFLSKKYKDVLRCEDNLDGKEPSEIASRFEMSAFGSHDKGDAAARVWREKVSRYLAYAVDGGILNSQLTLRDILIFIQQNKGSEQNDLLKLRRIIEYLLYFRMPEADFEHRDLHSVVNKILTSTGYTYNERVMRILIESGYVRTELAAENANIYAKFLIDIITRNGLLSLKSAICRQIIAHQAECKATGNWDDSMKTAYKQIVKPMVGLYQSPIPHIATLAAAALINLCSGNNKEVKQVIYLDGGATAAMQYLESRDEQLLQITLKMLSLLLSSGIFDPKKAETLVEKIIEILKGPGIPGTKHSDRVNTGLCNILAILAKDEDNKNLILYYEEGVTVDIAMKYITTHRTRSTEITDELECKALMLIKQICVKERDLKQKLCEPLQSHILHKIKSNHSELSKKINLYRNYYKVLNMLIDSPELPINYQPIQKYLEGDKKHHHDESVRTRANNILRKMEKIAIM